MKMIFEDYLNEVDLYNNGPTPFRHKQSELYKSQIVKNGKGSEEYYDEFMSDPSIYDILLQDWKYLEMDENDPELVELLQSKGYSTISPEDIIKEVYDNFDYFPEYEYDIAGTIDSLTNYFTSENNKLWADYEGDWVDYTYEPTPVIRFFSLDCKHKVKVPIHGIAIDKGMYLWKNDPCRERCAYEGMLHKMQSRRIMAEWKSSSPKRPPDREIDTKSSDFPDNITNPTEEAYNEVIRKLEYNEELLLDDIMTLIFHEFKYYPVEECDKFELSESPFLIEMDLIRFLQYYQLKGESFRNTDNRVGIVLNGYDTETDEQIERVIEIEYDVTKGSYRFALYRENGDVFTWDNVILKNRPWIVNK